MNKIRVIDALLLPFSKYLSDQRSPKESALRISVLSSGRILLEGKKATLARVKKALAKAQSARSAVWYYRESGKGEPPTEAIEIVNLSLSTNCRSAYPVNRIFQTILTTRATPAPGNDDLG